ncbi:hypothetical protein EJK80_08150 [Corynebacterium phoceense]|uniref:Uncharacterized protein n=1 Tax=Corynebacterium phoceense TaxID=1686286 RepID=A0A540R6E5_9CORY|nr:hypothetical protein EJK80_08150 [Corynebacterium phoceense]
MPNIIGALAGGNGDAQPPVDVPVALTVAENIARFACIILVVLPLGVGRVELRTRAAPRRHVHQLRRGAASPPAHRREPVLCCGAHLDYGAHPQRACS